MSKFTLVTVLTPTGRRQNVKCTPNYTILQILEEVCLKQGLKAEEYDLTHHNHRLDTTSTIRFSGIPNNAFLEMAMAKSARAEGKVTLGLQLENGERIMGSFDPVDSLYFILGTLVPEQTDLSLNPVVIYTRREVYGEADLKNTTLRHLGLTGGRAMLRLIHRTPEQLRVQANVSSVIPVKPKEEDIESPPVKVKRNELVLSSKTPPNNASDVVQEALAKHPDASQKRSPAGQIDKVEKSGKSNNMSEEKPALVQGKKIEDEIFIIGERNAIIFLHQSNKLPVLDDLPDDFYELSIGEVKNLLKDLQNKVQELTDAPLVTGDITKFEKDKKMLRDLNMYKKTIIRVQFPDQIVLQASFQPLENVRAVIEFVKSYLENPYLEFYLFSTPPKEVLNPNSTLLESNCVPSILLHFGTKNETQQRTFVRSDLLTKFSSFEGARHVATKLRVLNRRKIPSIDSREKNTEESRQRRQSSAGSSQLLGN